MKKVIIIGAGISGLSCAFTLAKAGKKVIILEGRSRLGGRIYTITCADNITPLELGASYWEGLNSSLFYQQFFSENNAPNKAHAVRLDETKSSFIPIDRQPEFDNILQYYHLAQEKLQGAEIQGVGKTFQEYIESISLATLNDNERYWTKRFLENSLQHHCTPLAEGGFPSFIRQNRDVNEAWNDKDADFCFVQNGWHQVITQLFQACQNEGVEIQLNQEVKLIKDRGQQGVEITTTQNTWFADKVISTIPIGVLKKKAEQLFSPPLSKEKVQALKCIGVHDATRVILEFPDTPFWDNWEGPYLYLDAKDSPTLLEFRNAYPLYQKAILLTGKYSDIARHLYNQYPHEKNRAENILLDKILSDLQRAFPKKTIPTPLKTIVYCWTDDPFAQGAYPYRTKEISEEVQCALEKKEGSIYFAGADFSRFGFSVHHGYFNGQKIAKEVLLALK